MNWLNGGIKLYKIEEERMLEVFPLSHPLILQKIDSKTSENSPILVSVIEGRASSF